RVDRPRKRVIAVFAEGQGIGKIGDGDEDRSIVVAHERDGVAQGHELHSLMSSCLRIASPSLCRVPSIRRAEEGPNGAHSTRRSDGRPCRERTSLPSWRDTAAPGRCSCWTTYLLCL